MEVAHEYEVTVSSRKFHLRPYYSIFLWRGSASNVSRRTLTLKKNMWDVPSRIFDADDVREGPGLDGIDEYMTSTFPGMVQISVSEQLKHYLRPGGLLAAYEQGRLRGLRAHQRVFGQWAPSGRGAYLTRSTLGPAPCGDCGCGCAGAPLAATT